VDVALGLARSHQGSPPDCCAADGHDSFAGQYTLDQQVIALAITHHDLTAGKALTVELDIDNRLTGVVDHRRVGQDDAVNRVGQEDLGCRN
jgi:hypothetical protein